jgi:replicative DNA helicase
MFSSVQTIPIGKIKRKPINFYLKDFLPMPENTVGMIASRGGMGKTFLSLRVAAEFVQETGKNVLAWFSEDVQEIIAYRFDTLVKSFGINTDTQNKIHYITTDPLQFALKQNGTFKANYEAIAGIRKDCIVNDIGLVIIDPLLAFYGGDENDNSQARVFMQVFLQWAKQDHINILFIHHGKKEDGGVRGASAFVDATRFVYELHYPMQGNEIDFDKKDLGIRRVRLTKDNHNVFYHFSKLFNGDGEGEIGIMPKATTPEVRYQDKAGHYTAKPQVIEFKPTPEEVKELTRDAVTISVAKHNNAKDPSNFIPKNVAWDELLDVMTMGKAYSPSLFKDNYRKSSNYLGGNEVVFLDIDDGMTLKEAEVMFANLKAILVTTKSHQKDKNGLTCDGFSVVLRLD